MTALTTADTVAALFDNDGQRFETVTPDAGAELTLEDACVDLYDGAKEWRDGWHVGDTYRYLFPDGSAIVVSGDAWDLEGAEPFAFRG